MIQDVKFNTKAKAERCLKALGKRGIDVFCIQFGDKIDGYWVHYWTV